MPTREALRRRMSLGTDALPLLIRGPLLLDFRGIVIRGGMTFRDRRGICGAGGNVCNGCLCMHAHICCRTLLLHANSTL